MLTPETLARLEAAALKQSGLEFGTTIAVMPGELLALVKHAREGIDLKNRPAFLVDVAAGTIEQLSGDI